MLCGKDQRAKFSKITFRKCSHLHPDQQPMLPKSTLIVDRGQTPPHSRSRRTKGWRSCCHSVENCETEFANGLCILAVPREWHHSRVDQVGAGLDDIGNR